MPRQPDVPNLIIPISRGRRTLAQGFSAGVFSAMIGPASSMSEKPVVLIADDDENVVALMQTFLRPLDCEFLVAGDGEEALTLAQARLPDIVLLDVLMPKRSGWEVCQALKGVQRTAHIPVVLMTARGDVKDR